MLGGASTDGDLLKVKLTKLAGLGTIDRSRVTS